MADKTAHTTEGIPRRKLLLALLRWHW